MEQRVGGRWLCCWELLRVLVVLWRCRGERSERHAGRALGFVEFVPVRCSGRRGSFRTGVWSAVWVSLWAGPLRPFASGRGCFSRAMFVPSTQVTRARCER
jgi:hypothetical protein